MKEERDGRSEIPANPSAGEGRAADPVFSRLLERSSGLQPWRRVLHTSHGLLIAAVVYSEILSRQSASLILGGIFLALLGLDAVRLRSPRANRLFFKLFIRFVSPREESRPASSTWYLLGVLVIVALFPRMAAVGGILVLALADPAANFVGRRWGRVSFGRNGTVEGTLAFLLTAFLTLLLLVGSVPALVGALGATLAERIPWTLDDNLTIPLATSFALWLSGLL